MNGMPVSELLLRARQLPSRVEQMPTVDRKLLTREILLGFWKVHILHHAAEHPVVGQWVLSELRRHGYDISPGTLYPLLKRMERNGWLRCEVEAGAGPRGRRYYHLTAGGAAVLEVVREAVGELHHEVVEETAAHARLRPVRLVARAEGMAQNQKPAGKKKPAAARPASVRVGRRRQRNR
jgi:PadR family transcriptional regulator, regulatory protein PadR